MKKTVLIIIVVGMLIGIMAAGALAQNYDIKVMTPEIRQALDNRRARFDELEALKQAGTVGENNRGYIEVLVPGSGAQTLADDENRDRKFIYTAIAEQNELTGAMGTIEDVFAEVQRTKAQPGDRIQLKNGQWVKK